ncbi:hypothetical protein PYCCODRAFT_1150244 [Trametes coccinea BRFM310]|uniref:Uncharacterized protein n=1 Tax=Trametes coccinea (strain BRFM310) TaxID=1353009 RepID=A0A1Y2I803_TRAC3|nr:hypothetical protein PYCCODRAFT_1150244 [Trametes coccinea BRFM310]
MCWALRFGSVCYTYIESLSMCGLQALTDAFGPAGGVGTGSLHRSGRSGRLGLPVNPSTKTESACRVTTPDTGRGTKGSDKRAAPELRVDLTSPLANDSRFNLVVRKPQAAGCYYH